MSVKANLYIYGVIAITIILIQCITANISDNEVNDIPETYSMYSFINYVFRKKINFIISLL